MVIASTTFIGEFLYVVFYYGWQASSMTSITVDCLCIVLYDVLYINVEPWSSQDITKRQIIYVCMYVCTYVCNNNYSHPPAYVFTLQTQ